MKHCPKCDFSFASFHHVCDFDGAELVDDPETLPVSPGVSALAAATQSPFLRLAKSPVFLAVLALAGVLSSALLIGYYDAASQPNSIAENQASRDSVVGQAPPAQAPAQPPAQPPAQRRTLPPSSARSEISKPKAAEDFSARGRRPVMASRSRARFRSSPSIRNQQSTSEIALQKEPKENAPQKDPKVAANQKEPKVAAMLKTAWHVLKKPFKF
jgi:hypothetical protein